MSEEKLGAIGDNVAIVIQQAAEPWRQIGERLLAGDRLKIDLDGPAFIDATIYVSLEPRAVTRSKPWMGDVTEAEE